VSDALWTSEGKRRTVFGWVYQPESGDSIGDFVLEEFDNFSVSV